MNAFTEERTHYRAWTAQGVECERIKPLFDSIFTPLGRNDVHVKSVTATKEHGDVERTEVLIEWAI